MTLVKYWVNRHVMVDERSAMRTLSDIPMYLAADVDTVLLELTAEKDALMVAFRDVTFAHNQCTSGVNPDLAALRSQKHG